MKPPDWFLVSARRSLRLSAVRVGLTLYELGHPGVDAGGNQVVEVKVSLTRLQQLTHLGRHGVIDGLEQLEDAAGLVRHPPQVPKTPTGYTLPKEKMTGVNTAPVVSPGPTFGGIRTGVNTAPPILVDEDEDLSLDKESTSSSPGVVKGSVNSAPVDADALLEGLARLQATDPRAFLEQFPNDLDRVRAWVEWALGRPKDGLKNPAGYIFRKLQAGKEPPELPDPSRGADPRDFTHGKYGHLVKY